MKKHYSIQKRLSIFCFVLLCTIIQAQNDRLVRYQSTLPNPAASPSDIAIKDRFNNTYTAAELKLPTAIPIGGAAGSVSLPQINHTCNAGMFKLHFIQEPVANYGFDSVKYRDVICEVFQDLNRLLASQNSSTVVHIFVGSDTSVPLYIPNLRLATGSDIAGTAFEAMKYNLKNVWLDNLIYTSIKLGSNSFNNLMGNTYAATFDIYHGALVVNFNGKSWYSNFSDTSSIPAAMDDLYTHTLRQALHMLGLNSNILSNGNAKYGNNLYSRYDNFLYKNTSANKLLTYDTATKKINKTTALALGCGTNSTYFMGSSLTSQLVYNDTPFTDNVNLSHFTCSGTGICNTSYAKPSNHFVLVPCLGSGQTYIKRHPHPNEVLALCDLGYKLRNIGGVYAYGNNSANNATAGNVYTTYSSCTETCVAVGGHDTVMMDTLRPLTKTFASILSNDMPTTSVIKRMELLDSNAGTLTYNATSFTFTPSATFKKGNVTIVYYPQCSNTAVIGSPTYITLIYPYPAIPPCQPDNSCKYICYGNFEESDDAYLWSDFNVYPPSNAGPDNTPELLRSVNGITCKKTLGSTYFDMCNSESLPHCFWLLKGLIPPVGGEEQFYGMYASRDIPTGDVYSEGIHFKLKQPIYHDTTKVFKLSFWGRVRLNSCGALPLTIAGDDTIPDKISTGKTLFTGGSPTICNKFCQVIGTTGIGSPIWTQYTVTLAQPPVGDSFTSIVIYTGANQIPEGQFYAYMDNFVLYDSSAQGITITSNPSNTMPCQDTTQTIAYYVCMKNGTATNTDSILLQATLPYGFSIASGSDFNANGKYTIPIGSISSTVCDTLYLKYTIDYSKVQYNKRYDISVGYNTNTLCNNLIADVVGIYPQNNAVTIDKSVSKINPNIGDTLTFNITVCNNSFSQINNAIITDTLPDGLTLLNANVFTANGKELTLTTFLDSAYSTGARCYNFIYLAVANSSCKITNKAYLSSSSNICFTATDSVVLNASATSSPVSTSITPDKAIWCGSNIPLKITINNPSGTPTYQWYRNDTILTGQTGSSHLATQNGLYSVVVNNGGCSSTIYGQPFDTVFVVNSSAINPVCTANNGSINLSPQNGVPPYTYAWNGGATTANRTGLSAGTYTVTVTDSIGCNKILSFNLTAVGRNILLTKTITQPICTLATGSIVLDTIKGGNAPYTFAWSDGSTLRNRNNLSAGTYIVTIMDNNGCMRVDTTIVSQINYSITVTDSLVVPNCMTPTGAIYLNNVSGGTLPYSYLWSNSSTTRNQINITAGTYRVTITDSMGCIGFDTIVLPSTNTTFGITATATNTLCNSLSGSLTATASGGVSPYSYLWNNGASTATNTGLDSGYHYLTVTDNNGCTAQDSFYVGRDEGDLNLTWNKSYDCTLGTVDIEVFPFDGYPPYTTYWNDGNSSAQRTGLAFNNYSLYLEDSLGCNYTIAFDLTASSGIFVGHQTTQPYCAGLGSIELNPTFGKPPFTYVWNDGSTLQNRYNLNMGIYAVTVYDSTGCSWEHSFSLINPKPSNLDAYISSWTDCVANTAKLSAKIISNTPNLTYLWSTGATTPSISIANTTPKYTVSITETNGCVLVLSESPSADSFIRLGSSYGINKLTDAVSMGKLPSNTLISKKNIRIGGIFELDSRTKIQYSDIQLEGGASIEVRTNCTATQVDTLFMHSNMLYTCGNTLAKGIRIYSCLNPSNFLDFTLKFTKNEIRDCYKALDIQRSLTPFISDNLFEDNLIGMHIHGSAVSTASPQKIFTPSNYTHIYNNLFRGSGTTASTGKVKRPYSGLLLDQYIDFRPMTTVSTTTAYGVPFAAIIAEAVGHLNIGAPTMYPNKIENMSNGILMYGTKAIIQNTKCYKSLYKSMSLNQWAIFAAGNTNTNDGWLSLYETNLNNSPTFSKYLGGVYCRDLSYAKIENLRLNGVHNGIYCVVNHSYWTNRNFIVKGCDFRSDSGWTAIGINLTDNTMGEFNAHFESNSFKDVSDYSIWANKNTMSFNNSSLFVYANSVRGNAYRGIELNNYPTSSKSQVVSVKNNSCIFGQNILAYGIHLMNCGNILMENNTVKSISPTTKFPGNNLPSYYPLGIFYENTTGKFVCNMVDSVRTGTRFMGNCDASDWKANKTRNHYYGLKIDTLTTLKDHYWAGNSFKGSCFKEAQSNQLRPTTFYYSNTSGDYEPNPKYPDPLFGNWWIYRIRTGGLPSETDDCSYLNWAVYNGSGGVGIPIGNKGDYVVWRFPTSSFSPLGYNNIPLDQIQLTKTDTAILMNNMVFGDFEAELTWQYRLELYNKVKPYESELKDTSIFRDYLAQIEDGSINEFTQINILDRQVYEAAQAYAAQVHTLRNNIDSLWDEVLGLDSAIHSTSDTAQVDSLRQSRIEQVRRIAGQDSALANLLGVIDSNYEAGISQLSNITDTIELEGTSDSLRREFLHLYYQTYGIGNSQPDPEQVQTYTTIAHHCPYESLDAVYRSRGILKSLGDTTWYNDSLLCAAVGITLKSTLKPIRYVSTPSKKELSFVVFPNPTNSITNIQLSYIPDIDLTFVVSDILGRELYREKRMMNTNRHTIDTKLWDNGVYMLRVLEGGSIVYKTQLQVIK